MKQTADQKAFTRQLIVDHVSKCGETADIFFEHWLEHYRKVDKALVTATIKQLIKSQQLAVTRCEHYHNHKVSFLVPA